MNFFSTGKGLRSRVGSWSTGATAVTGVIWVVADPKAADS
jgi:hypothetical protein